MRFSRDRSECVTLASSFRSAQFATRGDAVVNAPSISPKFAYTASIRSARADERADRDVLCGWDTCHRRMTAVLACASPSAETKGVQ